MLSQLLRIFCRISLSFIKIFIVDSLWKWKFKALLHIPRFYVLYPCAWIFSVFVVMLHNAPIPNPRSRSPTTVRCILRTRLINCPQLFPLFRFRASLHCNNTNSNTNSHPLQRWAFGKLFSFIVNDLRGSYRLKPRKSLFTPFALLKYFERLWLQASCCNLGNFICALSKFRQGKSCHKVISLAAAVPRSSLLLKGGFY